MQKFCEVRATFPHAKKCAFALSSSGGVYLIMCRMCCWEKLASPQERPVSDRDPGIEGPARVLGRVAGQHAAGTRPLEGRAHLESASTTMSKANAMNSTECFVHPLVLEF